MLKGVKDRIQHEFRLMVKLHYPMPNPADYVPPPKKPITYQRISKAFKAASKDYLASWKYSLGIKEDVKPDDSRQTVQQIQDLKKATKDFTPTMKDLFVTRLVAYRDAIKEFVAGYKIGVSEQNTGIIADLKKSLEKDLNEQLSEAQNTIQKKSQ